MQAHDELWELEDRLWRASGAGDGETYRELLVEEALLTFPDPVGALDREACAAAVGGGGRRLVQHRLEDRRTLPLADGVVLLAYRGVALWEGDAEESRDRRGSVFVRRPAGWRLAYHQVSPSG